MPNQGRPDRMKEGDMEAFQALYKDNFHKMVRFSYSYVRDIFVAESLVQDVFLKLWEKWELLPSGANLPAYLLTSVKNGTLNYLHRLKIKDRMEKDLLSESEQLLQLRIRSLEDCKPDTLFHRDIEKLVSEAMAALPERTREVFFLSRQEQLPNKTIAARLAISSKAVEFHITKALKVLRLYLRDYLVTLLPLICLGKIFL
ncbi:MAG TPA: RNA polymerase sigma-70 factor [Puia sp.]|jgi:RNA polymerase sigma-70 factor (ECF subfamily)